MQHSWVSPVQAAAEAARERKAMRMVLNCMLVEVFGGVGGFCLNVIEMVDDARIAGFTGGFYTWAFGRVWRSRILNTSGTLLGAVRDRGIMVRLISGGVCAGSGVQDVVVCVNRGGNAADPGAVCGGWKHDGVVGPIYPSRNGDLRLCVDIARRKNFFLIRTNFNMKVLC